MFLHEFLHEMGCAEKCKACVSGGARKQQTGSETVSHAAHRWSVTRLADCQVTVRGQASVLVLGPKPHLYVRFVCALIMGVLINKVTEVEVVPRGRKWP